MALPWPLMWGSITAAGLAGFCLVSYGLLPARGRPSAWFGLVLALVAAGAMTAFLVRRRDRMRASGQFEATVVAGSALRQGRLPEDPAARRELVRLLPGQLRVLSGPLRWFPVLFGMVALLEAVAALNHPRLWIAAGFFIAMAVSYAVRVPRQRRRAAAVAEQLAALGAA